MGLTHNHLLLQETKRKLHSAGDTVWLWVKNKSHLAEFIFRILEKKID